MLQQWCGINVIFNYAEEIFKAAGYKMSDILINIVCIGWVNLLFTFVAMADGGPLGPPAVDAVWLRRAGRALSGHGRLFYVQQSRACCAGAGAGRDCLLCHVAGPGRPGW